MSPVTTQAIARPRDLKSLIAQEFPKFDRKSQKQLNQDLVRENNEAERKIWRALREREFVGETIPAASDKYAWETAVRLSKDVPENRTIVFVSGFTSPRSRVNNRRKASAAIAYRMSQQKSDWVRRLYKVNHCGHRSDLHMKAELLGIAEALALALGWVVRREHTRTEQPEIVIFTSCSRVLRYIDRLRDEDVARKAASLPSILRSIS